MNGGFATNTMSTTWSCKAIWQWWTCHDKRNGGKLHGNISHNGYANAKIGWYGVCFEEGYVVGLWYRRKLRGTREASNGGRVRVCTIHGLNISHKELTYLLQKSTSHQKPSTTCMLLGGRLVGKYHRSSLTATHKEDNQKTSHAPTSLHDGSP